MASATYAQHFDNLPSNDQGNKNSAAFSAATASNLSQAARLKNVTASMDYVIATADGSNQIQLLHLQILQP